MSVTYRVSRLLFLRLIGCIYLVAFLSLTLQWYGLFSCDGLEPVFTFLKRIEQNLGPSQAVIQLPTLVWLHQHEWIGVDVDVWCQMLCLTGTILSLLTVIIGIDSATIYLILFLLYSSLQKVGQTFLSFQWDILLLESGLLAVFVSSMGIQFRSIRNEWQAAREEEEDEEKEKVDRKNISSVSRFLRSFLPSASFDTASLGMFLLRFLLFRLMFASGIVKIMSRCPTWARDLSAMEYHYATQCLPTPAAWFAHQLPPFIHQISTAVCLFVEIVCACLILVPSSIPSLGFLRRMAAWFQIILQVSILLTGNYTFFNWLTIALCLTLFSDQDWFDMMAWSPCSTRARKQIKDDMATAPAVSRKMNPSSPSSNQSEVEMQSTNKKHTNTTSNNPSTSASSPASVVKISRPSACSRLLCGACWFVRTCVKVSILVALAHLFSILYKVDGPNGWIGVGAATRQLLSDSLQRVAAAASATVSGSGSIATPWIELPYHLMVDMQSAFHAYTLRPTYTPTQVQYVLDTYFGFFLWFVLFLEVSTIFWSILSILIRIFGCASGGRSNRQQRRCAVLRWILSTVVTCVKMCIIIVCGHSIFLASLVPFTHSLTPSKSLPTLLTDGLTPIMTHIPTTWRREVTPVPSELGRLIRARYDHVAHWSVTSSYGLFRTMTGVGQNTKVTLPGQTIPITVTQTMRPELIIYGSFDDPETTPPSQTKWSEIRFKHKPSPIGRSALQRPTLVAPHQPRLDWQMWFAALGSQAPLWLIHLVSKLLDGFGETSAARQFYLPPVWSLLSSHQTFTPEHPPIQIKIELVHTDFTRMPGGDMGRLTPSEVRQLKQNNSSSSSSSSLAIPRAWWRQVSPRSESYLPPTSKESKIGEYLGARGLVEVCGKMRTDHLRTKGRKMKELLFVPEEENDNGNVQDNTPTKKRFFQQHDRMDELSFYLAWIESRLPTPTTYGPYSRQMTTFVRFARTQFQELAIGGEWQWIQSPIIRGVATSFLVVVLADIMIRR